MQSVYSQAECTMGEVHVEDPPIGTEEYGYSFKSQAVSVMLTDMRNALQEKFEHSILMVRRESYYFAGLLSAITMVILVVGALYCHFHANRRHAKLMKYTKLVKDENANSDAERTKTGEKGRAKQK